MPYMQQVYVLSVVESVLPPMPQNAAITIISLVIISKLFRTKIERIIKYPQGQVNINLFNYITLIPLGEDPKR
jgi:hypothetical protein